MNGGREGDESQKENETSNNECDDQQINDDIDNHLSIKTKNRQSINSETNIHNKNRFRDRSLNASISSAASSASKLTVKIFFLYAYSLTKVKEIYEANY